MEGKPFGKILQFPNSAANDNLSESPAAETGALDMAKEASVRRMVGETYGPGADMSLWSDARKEETRAALAGFTLEDAIRAINAATEDKVSARPSYYARLLEMLDEQTEDVQTTE